MYFVLLEPDLPEDIDPQGSSRSRGGTLRDKARGNVFNFADAQPDHDIEMMPVSGSVIFYIENANPSTLTDINSMVPSGSFPHTKVNTVAPILRRLVKLYPPVADSKGIF
jgi:hypothetical protein